MPNFADRLIAAIKRDTQAAAPDRGAAAAAAAPDAKEEKSFDELLQDAVQFQEQSVTLKKAYLEGVTRLAAEFKMTPPTVTITGVTDDPFNEAASLAPHQGLTALDFAALNGTVDHCQKLLEKKASPKPSLDRAVNASAPQLFEALANLGRANEFKHLLDEVIKHPVKRDLLKVFIRAHIELSENQICLALYAANVTDDASIVACFNENGVKLKTVIDKYQLLHDLLIRAKTPNRELLQALLLTLPNLNVKNQNADTPLILAAWRGHDEAIGQLLEAKADPESLDMHKHDALYCAFFDKDNKRKDPKKTLATLKALLESNKYTADYLNRAYDDPQKLTLSQLALGSRSPDVALYLLEKGLRLDKTVSQFVEEWPDAAYWHTPYCLLSYLALKNNEQGVQALLEKESKAITQQALTDAIVIAAHHKHDGVLRGLLTHHRIGEIKLAAYCKQWPQYRIDDQMRRIITEKRLGQLYFAVYNNDATVLDQRLDEKQSEAWPSEEELNRTVIGWDEQDTPYSLLTYLVSKSNVPLLTKFLDRVGDRFSADVLHRCILITVNAKNKALTAQLLNHPKLQERLKTIDFTRTCGDYSSILNSNGFIKDNTEATMLVFEFHHQQKNRMGPFRFAIWDPGKKGRIQQFVDSKQQPTDDELNNTYVYPGLEATANEKRSQIRPIVALTQEKHRIGDLELLLVHCGERLTAQSLLDGLDAVAWRDHKDHVNLILNHPKVQNALQHVDFTQATHLGRYILSMNTPSAKLILKFHQRREAERSKKPVDVETEYLQNVVIADFASRIEIKKSPQKTATSGSAAAAAAAADGAELTAVSADAPSRSEDKEFSALVGMLQTGYIDFERRKSRKPGAFVSEDEKNANAVYSKLKDNDQYLDRLAQHSDKTLLPRALAMIAWSELNKPQGNMSTFTFEGEAPRTHWLWTQIRKKSLYQAICQPLSFSGHTLMHELMLAPNTNIGIYLIDALTAVAPWSLLFDVKHWKKVDFPVEYCSRGPIKNHIAKLMEELLNGTRRTTLLDAWFYLSRIRTQGITGIKQEQKMAEREIALTEPLKRIWTRELKDIPRPRGRKTDLIEILTALERILRGEHGSILTGHSAHKICRGLLVAPPAQPGNGSRKEVKDITTDPRVQSLVKEGDELLLYLAQAEPMVLKQLGSDWELPEGTLQAWIQRARKDPGGLPASSLSGAMASMGAAAGAAAAPAAGAAPGDGPVALGAGGRAGSGDGVGVGTAAAAAAAVVATAPTPEARA